MQAIGYTRVSTAQQAGDGVSLAAQRRKIEAWCEANDVELTRVLSDEGISGKRVDNRPDLLTAIEAACRSGSVLVVYSLSRLARSTKDTIEIAERLDKAGADLVSMTEKIDTTSAAGKMVFRMLAVLSEFERDLVSERTKTALDHKRAKRERVGSVPFGFDLADDGVALVTNDDEQLIINLINELRNRGLSYRRIADELTGREIRTKCGNKTWTHTAVRRIVDRTAA